MKSGNYPMSRQDNIVIQELKNEVLIYDLQKNKALCLNETSALVWQECDGTKSVTEISQTLSKKLKSNVSEDIVWLALNQFKTDNLLAESNDSVTPLDGLTRREVVRRVGFASLVALPVISALVAPMAIHAQSSRCGGVNIAICVPNANDLNPDGCPCTGNLECQGVCPIAPGNQSGFCLGSSNGATPFCAPGNTSDLSADCCPCTANNECQGVCPISPGNPNSGFCAT